MQPDAFALGNVDVLGGQDPNGFARWQHNIVIALRSEINRAGDDAFRNIMSYGQAHAP